ncbi:hypothetical protein WBK31_22565 [Nonomuraea sp. N2-4H]
MISPPPRLPATPATPVAAVQVATARPRRAAGCAPTVRASEEGMMRAAPAPLSARAAMSVPVPGASAAARQPAANTPSPVSSTPLRP